jgi:hypothetical protein
MLRLETTSRDLYAEIAQQEQLRLNLRRLIETEIPESAGRVRVRVLAKPAILRLTLSLYWRNMPG